MRNILKLMIACVIMVAVVPVYAQSSKVKKATLKMEALQYEEVIHLLGKKAQQNADADVLRLMAKANFKLKRYKDAAQWYDQLVQLNEAVIAEDFLYQGYSYLYSGNCTYAQACFDAFIAAKPYDGRRAVLKDVCAYYSKLNESQGVDIQLLTMNSVYSDIGPAFFRNGLVFSSERPMEEGGTQGFKLLYSAYDEDANHSLRWSAPIAFANPVLKENSSGIAAFNANEDTLFITQNKSDAQMKKLVRLEILYAASTGPMSWGEVQAFPFNGKEWSTGHPAASPLNGELYFVSDMPGGFGGKDIYVSKNTDGHWSRPVNLGPNVNTEGDELYPFVDEDGVLFFSSDGHLGLGGQDIYQCKRNKDMQWGSVQNLGAGINSKADDFGFIKKRGANWGVFVSNRNGLGTMDELYSCHFSKQNCMIIAAKDSKTNELLTDVEWNVSEGAEIKILDANYSEVCLKDVTGMKLVFSYKGYEPQTIDLGEAFLNGNDTLFIEADPQLLSWRGRVLNSMDNSGIAGAELTFISTNGCAQGQLQTASDGSFELFMEEGCCYILKAQKAGYFNAQTHSALCSKELNRKGEEDEIFMQSYQYTSSVSGQLNKTSGLSFDIGHQTSAADASIPFTLNVYYDVGRASVRKEALTELKKLLDLLKTNPDIIVEIGSHTDSRGSSKFNKSLSNRRALAIVRWLVKRGIQSERLVPKGYGEDLPVNNCIDGVDCSENDYQMNRRTEFKVLGRVSQLSGSVNR